MLRSLLALLIVLSGWPALHPSLRQDPPLTAHDPELAVCARVSEERALETVRALVAFGPRMGGTESGTLAAVWLAERFRAAGLETEIVEDPELMAHAETSFAVLAVLSGPLPTDEERKLVLTHAWPWGFSPSAHGRAPLALEAAAGVALLAARGPRSRGAAALPAMVLVDGSTTRDGSWPIPGHLAARADNPYTVFGISRAEGAELRAHHAAGGTAEIEYQLESHIAAGRPRTVVAHLPARPGAPKGYLLFCAHGDSDSGGPGADDNGSGEAVLLEIATAWAAAVRENELPAPPREVRFAVWGSEIHSTKAFLERAEKAGDLPLAVINYDQAGYGTGADQLNIEPDDLPANEPLVRLLAGLLTERIGTKGFPTRFATNKSLGGTDSYVFSEAPAFRDGSRPAVTLFVSAWGEPAEHPRTPGMPGESWGDRDHVTVDYDLYYHSAGDRPELTVELEPWNMGWCARTGLAGALRFLDGLDASGR